MPNQNELKWEDYNQYSTASAFGFDYKVQWQDHDETDRFCHAYLVDPQDATFGAYPTKGAAKRACEIHHNAILAAIEESQKELCQENVEMMDQIDRLEGRNLFTLDTLTRERKLTDDLAETLAQMLVFTNSQIEIKTKAIADYNEARK